jgi:hypothetical protein
MEGVEGIMNVLDVKLYLKGKISTYKPVEIDSANSIRVVTIMLDCRRKFYFDQNGFQCDHDGTLALNPIYLLLRD